MPDTTRAHVVITTSVRSRAKDTRVLTSAADRRIEGVRKVCASATITNGLSSPDPTNPIAAARPAEAFLTTDAR